MGSIGSSCGTDINVYCEDNLRSLSENEIQTVVEMREEYMAKKLGGPINKARVIDQSTRVDAVEDLEQRGQEQLSSTPLMKASRVGKVADSSKRSSESPLRSSVGVALMISEEEELMYEVPQSGKTKKKSIDGDGTVMATPTIGLTTEIRLSEMDQMISQRPTTSHFKVALIGGNFWGV